MPITVSLLELLNSVAVSEATEIPYVDVLFRVFSPSLKNAPLNSESSRRHDRYKKTKRVPHRKIAPKHKNKSPGNQNKNY